MFIGFSPSIDLFKNNSLRSLTFQLSTIAIFKTDTFIRSFLKKNLKVLKTLYVF